ncbi:MAG: hypothetical protein MJ230_00735 [bacterium]|nr:hypothetical protein [bacterium]
MQINRIQSYGSSYLNNMSVVNNNKTQTSPSFGLKVKVPVDIPDNIKTLDALKDYLNGKNMLGLLSVVAATLGIKEGNEKTEETAVFSEAEQQLQKQLKPLFDFMDSYWYNLPFKDKRGTRFDDEDEDE